MNEKRIRIVRIEQRHSLDDPDWPYIMRHVKSLKLFIERRPERRERIVQQLDKLLEARATT